ncbi:MAG: glutamine synthetase family protein [Candidatus Peregrinibacteria bacterium]|nr:glutamine synthetase family protein [Candidatus Peregrinibacteria bacterium]
MSDNVLGAVGTKTTERVGIKGREREYGAVLWKQPNLLDLSYSELEEKNLEVKMERLKGTPSDALKGKFLDYLKNEAGIKAVVVCFSDLEGRLHMLDYDKKFILSSEDNLTFDGSSIRGFTAQSQSDLRLKADWSTFRWLPSDLFGAGKVLVFGNVCDKDGTLYKSDFRSNLAALCDELRTKEGVTVNIAPEIEGFLFKGEKVEQEFSEKVGFELATMSGYFSSLPQDTLRLFIDKFAEVQRALGFQNEKDHPEVAPAQFELNFRYSVALDAADQIQIYKLLARQVAASMGFTACFLPKPIQGLNGSGMHTNMSFSKDGVNMFYDKAGEWSLSETARKVTTGILYFANDCCLLINSSVNAYRRLDPHFEAPNEIKVSAVDRGSMVRIPIGNEKSSRIEVRTVAPDANPYLAFYGIIKAGLVGMRASAEELAKMEKKVYGGKVKKLPGNIYEALEHFEASDFVKDIIGEENQQKYAALKYMAAERSPKSLGTKVKTGEVLYHHEVANQWIWNQF